MARNRIIPKSILILCINLLTLISPSNSRFLDTRCDDGNYTANSNYETNLNSVISSLATATTTANNGFFNRSTGQPPDTVIAFVICRGDIEPETCRRCVNDSFGMANRYCPYRKRATVWYDECMLRFSNETILGSVDRNGRFIWTLNTIPNANEFYQAMRPLMDRLKTEAAGGDSSRKFASGDTPGPSFMTIYGLMQCTPELSENECYNCLDAATNEIPNCCNDSLDVRILYPICIVRYSSTRFFNATVVLSPPPAPPPISTLILRYAKFGNNKRANALENDDDSRLISLAMVQFLENMERERPIRFTSQQLKIATDNFNIRLGSGGFGIVFKGIVANNPVAVKVLNGTSNQRVEEQFMAEVSTMGRTHHINLVRLYGICFESSLIALVYEYMVNGSLDNHLFKPNNRVSMLGFDKLHEIAVGTARGIAYLHEDCAQRIVHYDIKPGNILLDSNFCAKVADFGLAKLCNRDNTHITMTHVRGTLGYAAPELWMPLRVTYKCDVYSFGMLLFEIIGRRRNMDITLLLVIANSGFLYVCGTNTKRINWEI